MMKSPAKTEPKAPSDVDEVAGSGGAAASDSGEAVVETGGAGTTVGSSTSGAAGSSPTAGTTGTTATPATAPTPKPKAKKSRARSRAGIEPNNVRKLRQEAMMSKAELARRAGVSPLTIDRVEAGCPCRMDTKRKILEALGLKPSARTEVWPDIDDQG